MNEDKLQGPSRPLSDHIRDHVVVRDARFIQFYADVAISLRAPRNLELAFLKIESIFTNCSVEEDEEIPSNFNMGPSVRELGRATLPISVAVTLAIDILAEIAPTGMLDPDDFEQQISSMIKTAREAASERRAKKADDASETN